MPDDVLRIRNMRFYGYHGLLQEEAKLGQHFEVDVEIFGCFDGWAKHGPQPDVKQVDGAVNYPDVYNLVESIVVGERYGLVELLADRLATAIEADFGIQKFLVRVRKPNPPVSGHFDGVEVEVSRGLD